MSREHEHTLNVWLASHLKKLGLNAKPEVIRAGNRRIDIEIKVEKTLIAIEAERGHNTTKRNSAIKDADARIKQKLAQCAIAVCYPDNVNEESLLSSELIWTVRDPETCGSHNAQWDSGTIDRLASVVRLAPAQLGNVESLATALSSSLDGAVMRLSESQKIDLAKVLDLPVRNKGNSKTKWDPATKRAFLVVITAMMFHARLDDHRPQSPRRAQQ